MGQEWARISAAARELSSQDALACHVAQVQSSFSASFCWLQQAGTVVQVGQQGDQRMAGLRGSPVDHGRDFKVEKPAVTLAHHPLQRLRQLGGRLSHTAPGGALLAAALLDPGTPHLQAEGGPQLGSSVWGACTCR